MRNNVGIRGVSIDPAFEVSLIVPVYNTQQYMLERAIKSIELQDVLVQAVFIDDGSDSSTATFLDTVVASREGWIVIHKPNGGVSSARNAGLRVVTAPYVAFLDADDALKPEYLKEAIDILKKTGADVVFGGWDHEYLDGTYQRLVQEKTNDLGYYLLTTQEEIDAITESLFVDRAMSKIGLTPKRYVSACAALYKQSAIQSLRFNESIVISEDRMFNHDLFDQSHAVAVASSVWYRYIQNESSASTRIRPHALEELTATAEVFRGYLRRDNPYFDACVWKGVLECFEQMMSFSVLNRGFRKVAKISRTAYVKKAISVGVFQDAFSHAPSWQRSWKVVCLFGRKKAAVPLLVCFALRKYKNTIKDKRSRSKNPNRTIA